jgi:hypothetical protein
MVRRAAAWAAGIDPTHLPVPTADEIFLVEPNVWRTAVYVHGRRVAPSLRENVIIGPMDVVVESSAPQVDFYLDGEKCHSDSAAPYVWSFDLRLCGRHELRAEAIGTQNSEVYARMEAIFIGV